MIRDDLVDRLATMANDVLGDAGVVIVNRLVLMTGLRGEEPADIALEMQRMVSEKLAAVTVAQAALIGLTFDLVTESAFVIAESLLSLPTACDGPFAETTPAERWITATPVTVGRLLGGAYALQDRLLAGGCEILEPIRRSTRDNATRLARCTNRPDCSATTAPERRGRPRSGAEDVAA